MTNRKRPFRTLDKKQLVAVTGGGEEAPPIEEVRKAGKDQQEYL
jgi:hypothetical protein